MTVKRRYLTWGGALMLATPLLAGALLSGCAEPFPTLTYAERPCYRTLGTVDCHAVPLPGEASRKVGFYDPPIVAEPVALEP